MNADEKEMLGRCWVDFLYLEMGNHKGLPLHLVSLYLRVFVSLCETSHFTLFAV